MRVRRLQWQPGRASDIASEARSWAGRASESVDLGPIERAVTERGDEALAELTARYDATELRRDEREDTGDATGGGASGWLTPDGQPWRIRVSPRAISKAASELAPDLREALEIAIANVSAVAHAQLGGEAPAEAELPQGQLVTVREVPVAAAGIYAPGGLAAYPSSLIMGAVPARVAGVGRVAVCTPPGPDGLPPDAVLAAAALCEVDELYAVGGAQAIFAMARGTETIAPVDVIAGPGSNRVQEAKRAVFGEVGIDSIAGPSELMVITGPGVAADWIALDLCAQAEHGSEGLLLVASTDAEALSRIEKALESAAATRPGVTEAPLALIEVPGTDEAVALAEAVAPEHLQIDLDDDESGLGRPGEMTRKAAAGISTAGCVFLGAWGATAFGDYMAGSNHVLPTGGAGRFCGPLGPSVFRRRISNVTVDRAAAVVLAPHVDRLAREEGLPVHGESALARALPPEEAGPAGRSQ